MACAHSAAPAALLDLSSMPDDPQRREELIESTEVRPGPETRKPLPGKLHSVETGAAMAAAVLGMIFSKTPNVLLGGGAPLDENRLVDPSGGKTTRRGEGHGQAEDGAKDGGGAVDATQLVPWVVLRRPEGHAPEAPGPEPQPELEPQPQPK